MISNHFRSSRSVRFTERIMCFIDGTEETQAGEWWNWSCGFNTLAQTIFRLFCQTLILQNVQRIFMACLKKLLNAVSTEFKFEARNNCFACNIDVHVVDDLYSMLSLVSILWIKDKWQKSVMSVESWVVDLKIYPETPILLFSSCIAKFSYVFSSVFISNATQVVYQLMFHRSTIVYEATNYLQWQTIARTHCV